MHKENILWHRLDTEGSDACQLEKLENGWRLRGSAIFVEDGVTSCVHYDVIHDLDWMTQKAELIGWSGHKDLSIQVTRSNDGQWVVDGQTVGALDGLYDIDLGFTPATNTTAIRRLNLEVGGSGRSVAVWLDTEDWQFKPLQQEYVHTSDDVYEYKSIASGYTAKLKTTQSGLVTSYPEIWQELPV